jgi:uncharacterized protein
MTLRCRAAIPRARWIMAEERSKKTVTLVLTEDCNFACRYCYLVHKSQGRRMPLEVARAAVDYVLGHPDLFWEDEVVWDFMGGEPLLEVDSIERIIDFIRLRTYELDHPWFARSWFSISTNGSLYHTPRVQRLIQRFRNELEINITLDGPRHVHDLERVFPDGTGTYGQVASNIPLWLGQFPRGSSKVTISHGNLPHAAEAVLHLFSLGIRTVNSNVVFEDVWQPGDASLLERQLDLLADAMLEHGLWRDHQCSFFGDFLGRPLDPVRDNGNWCGPGRMLAVDAEGVFYPCNRFMSFSLARRGARSIGSLREGLDLNRLRPFLSLTRTAQSPRECIGCEVASGCAWCQGHNFDAADTPTIFQRATHICEMHRARVRANERYQGRLKVIREEEARARSVSGEAPGDREAGPTP